jgi:hypothetical protein
MKEHDALPERGRYLVMMAAAPSIWMVQFLATYTTAAVWCARFAARDDALGTLRLVVLGYAAVALLGIVIVGVSGYRRHALGNQAPPHDMDTPGDRHRFLGFATVLLAGLSGVASIYVGMTGVIFQTCR